MPSATDMQGKWESFEKGVNELLFIYFFACGIFTGCADIMKNRILAALTFNFSMRRLLTTTSLHKIKTPNFSLDKSITIFKSRKPSSHSPQESMDSLHRRLERSRQMQTVLRAFEARDRNLLEDNLWRVSFWSCASVLVMLCVALTQVNEALTHHAPQYGNSAAKVWGIHISQGLQAQ